MLPSRIQQVSRNRAGKIAVGLLDQQAVAEIEHVAMERQLVRVPRLAKQQGRLADQIEREIGEAKIDFERRRMAAPFGQSLPQHQRIVAQPQQIILARGVVRPLPRRVECAAWARCLGPRLDVLFDRRQGRHQMCFTSSGMS